MVEKMRYLIIAIIALGLLLVAGTACTAETAKSDTNDDYSEGEWFTRVDEGLEAAQEKEKPVFLLFTGSDWCVWCKKLSNEVLNKEAFSNWAKDNMILVKLDFLRKTKQPADIKKYQRKIAKKYGIRGFPTVLLLDKNGEVIAKTGYQKGGAENYITHIKNKLKQQ